MGTFYRVLTFNDKELSKVIIFEDENSEDRDHKLNLYLKWAFKYGTLSSDDEELSTVEKVMMVVMGTIMVTSAVIAPAMLAMNNKGLLQRFSS